MQTSKFTKAILNLCVCVWTGNTNMFSAEVGNVMLPMFLCMVHIHADTDITNCTFQFKKYILEANQHHEAWAPGGQLQIHPRLGAILVNKYMVGK